MPKFVRLSRVFQSSKSIVLIFVGLYIILLISIQNLLSNEDTASNELEHEREFLDERATPVAPAPLFGDGPANVVARQGSADVDIQPVPALLPADTFEDFRKILQSYKANASNQKVPFNVSSHRIIKELAGLPPVPKSNCVGKRTPERYDFVELVRHFYVFSLFWDARVNDFDNAYGDFYVRAVVLASRSHMDEHTLVYCVFQDAHGVNASSKMRYYEMCENHGLPAGGFIMSCRVPQNVKELFKDKLAPCSVRLSPSTAYDDPKAVDFSVTSLSNAAVKRDFSVCISPIYGEVQSSELMEWMELLHLVGAQHTTFYNLNLSPAAEALLKMYAHYNRARVIPWNITEEQDSAIWYHGQIIALVDCLFRTMPESKYVAFIDIDEMIVPYNYSDWGAMVESVFDNDVCALSFDMAYFTPGENKVEPAFRHLKTLVANSRTALRDQVRTKIIAKPEMVFEIGIHHISKPVFAHLKTIKLGYPDAMLHHYRNCRNSFVCHKHREENIVRNRYSKNLANRVKLVEDAFYDITGIHINRPSLLNIM